MQAKVVKYNTNKFVSFLGGMDAVPLLMSSWLRSVAFSAVVLFGCRKTRFSSNEKSHVSGRWHGPCCQACCRQDPSHWLGCPVDQLYAAGMCVPASCSEGMCCRGSHVQSKSSVVASPPQPLEMSLLAGQCTPAKNMGTTWPKPNEWEPEVGGPGAGLKTNERTERKKNSCNCCELLKTQNKSLLFRVPFAVCNFISPHLLLLLALGTVRTTWFISDSSGYFSGESL